jgi:hypothetical protein
MPDFFVVAPRPFTGAESDAMAEKGAATTAVGRGEPPVISWIPGRTVLVNADDKAAALKFVLDEMELSPDEAAQVKVSWPPEAAD